VPTLHWIGKEKVINHHMAVPFRVLEHQYGFTGQGEQREPTTSGNKIIHGDNLEALKALLPQYEGQIKCIYIDPPYNTGKESWRYNDNVNDPKILRWLNEVVGKEGEDLTRHDKWLCMMYPRLKLMHKLLSLQGTIIVSVDDSEQASVKLVLDEIFGRQNALLQGVVNKASEIASAYTVSKHEHFLIYTRSQEHFSLNIGGKFTLSRGTVGNEKQTMPVITFPAGLPVRNLADGVYDSSRKIEGSSENIENLDPLIVKKGKLGASIRMKAKWRSSNDMRNFFKNECRPTPAKINGIIEEIYIDGDRFMPFIKKNTSQKVSSLFLGNRRGSLDLENLGLKGQFENPKALPFLEYLLEILTGEDDIVLDSFAGSGTTAHAVLNLNLSNNLNRRFILIELGDYANTLTAERIKRVIQKNFTASEGSCGFDYYELGEPIFTPDSELNELAGRFNIRSYVWYTETKQPYTHPASHNEYLLGTYNGTVYYFVYDEDGTTTLDYAFLATMDAGFKGDQYVIYADNCLLPVEFMQKKNIVFKKIPRDITKF